MYYVGIERELLENGVFEQIWGRGSLFLRMQLCT